MPYYNAFPIFNKGLLAVNFFFSLSGFLIIRNLYLEYKKTNTIRLFTFFRKRIKRIYPIYFLVVIIGIFIYHVAIPLFGIYYETNYSVVELSAFYLFFVPNIFNSNNKVGGILNIVWSIGVEEQFYLFIPFFFILFGRKIKIAILVLVMVLLLLLLFYEAFYCYRNFYFYFLLSGLLAVFAEEGKLNFLKYKFLSIFIIILFLLNFFTDYFTFRNTFRYYHLFNLLLSSLFLVSIAYFPLFKLESIKLNYLGTISYGIYMYHMIVTTLYLYVVKLLKLDELVGEMELILLNNIVIITLTLFISHLSYNYFEKLFYLKS